jgi:hypothetical protein
MNRNKVKQFALGVAIVASGMVAAALTLPNLFAAGDGLSAKKLNDNFAALKTAVDALEAPNSVTTAKIADGAVTAAKIKDEPGGGQGIFQLEIPGATPDFQIVEYGVVTLQAPGPGVVLAIANGKAEATHVNGTKSGYVFGIKAGNVSKNTVWGLPATAAAGTYEFSMGVQTMFPVAAAGPVTVTLFGDKIGPSVAGGGTLSLVYLPTTYGPVVQ